MKTIDGLGRHVVSQTSRQPQLTQLQICATPNSSVRCEAESAKLTSEHRLSDTANAQEFHQIKQFVAACRRQWPGAMIVLRPDGARTGASAPTNPKPAPGAKND
jgi:hypothetical protein